MELRWSENRAINYDLLTSWGHENPMMYNTTGLSWNLSQRSLTYRLRFTESVHFPARNISPLALGLCLVVFDAVGHKHVIAYLFDRP